MARGILLVLDSLGIGQTPDAGSFGDAGADTLGHIAAWCAAGNVSPDRPEAGPLRAPNLTKLGLGAAAELATGQRPAGFEGAATGFYAACRERSSGKDTPSGHWEMAGAPVEFDWGYFSDRENSFPAELMDRIIARAALPGALGNCHASGTVILDRLGDDHVATGKPIFYTSADSVFQIAAHEDSFGLDRLYALCEIAREEVDAYRIGRVIARPFVGADGVYKRTGNRRDYATPPHTETLLDVLSDTGREVVSVGKIADIFAHRGFSKKIKATGHDALFDATIAAMNEMADGGLVFTNFVEFDQSFGHRRNVGGYAAAIEHFDARIPEVMNAMRPDDLLILTADHGCDPTWDGTDHTREHVPFLAWSPALEGRDLGIRDSFADIGATLAKHLSVRPLGAGTAAF